VSFERRDPDDPDVPGEPTASDIDAAFAQIIAGWDADGRSRWAGDDAAVTEEIPTAPPDPGGLPPAGAPPFALPLNPSGTPGPPPATPPVTPPAGQLRPAPADPPPATDDTDDELDDEPDDGLDDGLDGGLDEDELDGLSDDDHFVPPEPPPFPRPQPATVGAVGLFVLGIVLLTVPGWIGFSEQYGLPLGLLSMTGAIVWLVARLRDGPPTDSGWDDGAQV
jgi:hypothetical protein